MRLEEPPGLSPMTTVGRFVGQHPRNSDPSRPTSPTAAGPYGGGGTGSVVVVVDSVVVVRISVVLVASVVVVVVVS
jgi:hypothetical protein